MKIKPFLTSLIGVFYSIVLLGQPAAPTIKGTAKISIKKGTIECDFIMSDMPNITSYSLRINSGMNIRAFKDLKYGIPLYYDTEVKDTLSYGSTMGYYLHENVGNPGRYLPEQLEVKYAGMFPVVPDSASGYQATDFRGNVAFNGYSLRVDGFQAAWYPVLYDMKNQVQYDKVRYDITLSCDDCSVLFVNGSSPVKARAARFSSIVPRQMSIYVGNFETVLVNDTWILNPDMSKSQQSGFIGLVNGFKDYYQNSLGIPFKGEVTFVQTKPTASPDHAFAFVSSPTIFNVGVGDYGLGGLFNPEGGIHMKQVLAHELAHYYFGTYLRMNTEFGHVIDEGFAEYLSFKAVRHNLGEAAYKEIIDGKLAALKHFAPLPFTAIRDEKDYKVREYYLYYFAPIILIAIEKEIGEKAMLHWLNIMLNTKTDFTDYPFMERTFLAAQSDKLNAKILTSKYFSSPDALKNAVKVLHAAE